MTEFYIDAGNTRDIATKEQIDAIINEGGVITVAPSGRISKIWFDPDFYPGFVYFIEAGDFIKIGYSTNINARIAQLQGANPVRLKLIGYRRGSPEMERELHARFKKSREINEWFRKTPELVSHIRKNASRP